MIPYISYLRRLHHVTIACVSVRVCVCPHIPYKGDSEFEEDTEVRGLRVAAQETVSVEEGGQDSCHLEQTHKEHFALSTVSEIV